MFSGLNLSSLARHGVPLSPADDQTASYGVIAGGDAKSSRLEFVFPGATPLQERRVGTTNFGGFRRADAYLSKVPPNLQGAERQFRAIVDKYTRLTEQQKRDLQNESNILYSAAYCELARLPMLPGGDPKDYLGRQVDYLTRARDISDIDGQPSYMLSKIMLVYGSKCGDATLKNSVLTLAAAHAQASLAANPQNPGALVLSKYMGLCKKPQDMDTTDRKLDAYIEGYPKDHPDVPRQMRYCQLMLIDQGLLPGGNGSVYKDWGGRETILDAIQGLPDGDYRKGRGYVLLAIRDFFREIWVGAKGLLLPAVALRSGRKPEAYQLLYRLHLKATACGHRDSTCSVAEELEIDKKSEVAQEQYFADRGVDIEGAKAAEGVASLAGKIKKSKQLAEVGKFDEFSKIAYPDLCKFVGVNSSTEAQQEEIADLQALSERLCLQTEHEKLLQNLCGEMDAASDMGSVMKDLREGMEGFKGLRPGGFTVSGQDQDTEVNRLWAECAVVISGKTECLLGAGMSANSETINFVYKELGIGGFNTAPSAAAARAKIEQARGREQLLAGIDDIGQAIRTKSDSGDVNGLIEVAGLIEALRVKRQENNPPDGASGHLTPAELQEGHEKEKKAYQLSVQKRVRASIEASSSLDAIKRLLDDAAVNRLLEGVGASLREMAEGSGKVENSSQDFKDAKGENLVAEIPQNTEAIEKEVPLDLSSEFEEAKESQETVEGTGATRIPPATIEKAPRSKIGRKRTTYTRDQIVHEYSQFDGNGLNGPRSWVSSALSRIQWKKEHVDRFGVCDIATKDWFRRNLLGMTSWAHTSASKIAPKTNWLAYRPRFQTYNQTDLLDEEFADLLSKNSQAEEIGFYLDKDQNYLIFIEGQSLRTYKFRCGLEVDVPYKNSLTTEKEDKKSHARMSSFKRCALREPHEVINARFLMQDFSKSDSGYKIQDCTGEKAIFNMVVESIRSQKREEKAQGEDVNLFNYRKKFVCFELGLNLTKTSGTGNLLGEYIGHALGFYLNVEDIDMEGSSAPIEDLTVYFVDTSTGEYTIKLGEIDGWLPGFFNEEYFENKASKFTSKHGTNRDRVFSLNRCYFSSDEKDGNDKSRSVLVPEKMENFDFEVVASLKAEERVSYVDEHFDSDRMLAYYFSQLFQFFYTFNENKGKHGKLGPIVASEREFWAGYVTELEKQKTAVTEDFRKYFLVLKKAERAFNQEKRNFYENFSVSPMKEGESRETVIASVSRTLQGGASEREKGGKIREIIGGVSEECNAMVDNLIALSCGAQEQGELCLAESDRVKPIEEGIEKKINYIKSRDDLFKFLSYPPYSN